LKFSIFLNLQNLQNFKILKFFQNFKILKKFSVVEHPKNVFESGENSQNFQNTCNFLGNLA